MKFIFLILITIILLTSCASYNYDGTKYKIENNTVKICSENLNYYSILNSKNGELITESNSKTTEFFINKIDKNKLSVTLENQIYDPISIELKKSVRPIALTKDVVLSVFTFGIPVLFDIFNPDFYKLSTKSKNINVRFDFKQSYMLDEYNKISKSDNPNDYQNWIEKYPKSNIRQKVIDKKDSLELLIALSKESEVAIDEYITTHKESIYLKEALNIKNEMVAAREMFEAAKLTNSIASYEAFLARFPKSLHNRDAHRNLVFAAEKSAINSGNLSSMQNYIIKYLDVNTFYFSQKELEEKKVNISKVIDNQLVKEFIKKDSKNIYSDYSKLWQAYVKMKNEIPNGYLNRMDQTISFQSKICDLLFNKIKEVTSKEKQKLFVDKSMLDFPELDTESKSQNLIISILEKTKNGSGLVKLYDVAYISHYLSNLSEGNVLKGVNSYTYRNADYEALNNITYEELSFSNGKLNGISKCFQHSTLAFSLNMSYGISKELSYYQNGKLAKTMYYPTNGNPYYYEFDNGKNLTLQIINDVILELDKVEKSIKKYTAEKKYDLVYKEINNVTTIADPAVKLLQINNIPSEKGIKLLEKKANELKIVKEMAITKKKKEDEALLGKMLEIDNSKEKVLFNENITCQCCPNQFTRKNGWYAHELKEGQIQRLTNNPGHFGTDPLSTWYITFKSVYGVENAANHFKFCSKKCAVTCH